MNAPLRRLTVVVAVLFVSLMISSTWIQVVAAPSLNDRGDNVRSLYKEYGRQRGPLLVAGDPVAESTPVSDVYRYQRRYPGKEVYSAVTGSYSIVYGATGMESASDDFLSGTADQLFYRRIGDLLTGAQPRGASVELTLDPKAQRAAWNALGNQRGAAVALDPRTGDVLALVSKPGYDPATLAGHDGKKVRAARAKLLADPARPLENRAIAGRLYPPGSTFKLITAAAALESGRYREDSQVPAPHVLDLPQTSATLKNFDGEYCGNGSTTSIKEALRVSCNTAFGSLGLALGDVALREQAQKFGFGADLSIPLRATPSSFPAELNQPQTAQAAIGQYDVRVTPLQMAMVAAGIANGGVVMKPNLVREVRSGDALDVVERPSPQSFGTAISADTASQLTDMMTEVVRSGTGGAAAIDGITVAGKTGTAQHAKGEPPHAWFTCFAPAEDPRVAVAVVVEDGGSLGSEATGGRAAAPVAKAVMEAVLRR